MCGISAVVALRDIPARRLKEHGYSETLKAALEQSLDVIKHRGPDDRGQWHSSDNRVGRQSVIHCVGAS